jgi:hypothetical protein
MYDVNPRGVVPEEPKKCCTLMLTLMPGVEFIMVPSFVSGDSAYECEILVCPDQPYEISSNVIVDGYTYHSVTVQPK